MDWNQTHSYYSQFTAGQAACPLAVVMAHICIHGAQYTVEKMGKGTAVTQQGSVVHALLY